LVAADSDLDFSDIHYRIEGSLGLSVLAALESVTVYHDGRVCFGGARLELLGAGGGLVSPAYQVSEVGATLGGSCALIEQPGEPVAGNLLGGFCEGGRAQATWSQDSSLPTTAFRKISCFGQ
jgi:hypothetical protein